ncbi:MAG TPA: 23S rRNA (adenine(2503)-C(2))-methyltransferase RlmN [Terriglobales bacterium]|nr:23S rRNA (adenine(2503)-C(2))-methyltransferase RlmN [Terriglobales bacterium]
MAAAQQTELLGLDFQELTALVQESGEPGYRARQLFEAVYRQRVRSLEEISTLPLEFRRRLLGRSILLGQPRIEKCYVSSDGSIRYLIAFADGQSVETVWMPEGDGGEAGDEVPSSEYRVPSQYRIPSSEYRETDSVIAQLGTRNSVLGTRPRATMCVSSQVGCAVDCKFCMTALLGLQRNLSAGEIVGQVVAVLNDRGVDLDRDRINLVFMGQGEPFLNYDNFMKAVRLLVQGVGIAESRTTVSTAGIVPRIYDFGREPLRPKLAISLNASSNALRRELMPITRKWDMEQLIAAAQVFPLRPRERLTFEYVLLDQVNDNVEDARQVAESIRGIRAKVNLIALNPGPGIDFRTPAEERVLAFQQILLQAGVPAFIRRPRGRDIYAACGQLKLSMQ